MEEQWRHSRNGKKPGRGKKSNREKRLAEWSDGTKKQLQRINAKKLTQRSPRPFVSLRRSCYQNSSCCGANCRNRYFVLESAIDLFKYPVCSHVVCSCGRIPILSCWIGPRATGAQEGRTSGNKLLTGMTAAYGTRRKSAGFALPSSSYVRRLSIVLH